MAYRIGLQMSRVDRELSAKIQEVAFKLGLAWEARGSQRPLYTHKHLFIPIGNRSGRLIKYGRPRPSGETSGYFTLCVTEKPEFILNYVKHQLTLKQNENKS